MSELWHLDVFLPTGGTVKLGEIGSINDTSAEKRLTARYAGKEGISLSLVKLGDIQPIQLADNVRSSLEILETQFPDDVNSEVVKEVISWEFETGCVSTLETCDSIS